ncbi:MAG: RnfABCDGE type electron transport complex subunit D [Candidatus Woesearchaeota archaeon]
MIVSHSPHILHKITTNKLYLLFIIGLLFPTAAGIYFFGMSALFVILVCIVSAILFDFIFQLILKKKPHLSLSTIITSLLLALVLPPTVPWWIPVFGVIIAVGIVKYAFGPGNAIFNPALAARTFLAVSFPLLMSTYVAVDGTTSATPLAVAKLNGFSSLVAQYSTTGNLYFDLFIGNRPGCIGETSAMLILIGGLFLICFKVIDWRIPFFYLGSVAVLSFAFGHDVLFSLLSGGLLLGAFFMATDYVTSPLSRKGKIFFAIGCGLLTVILRIYSGYPEGVAFSILLMNAAVPLIDRLVKPKPFGY